MFNAKFFLLCLFFTFTLADDFEKPDLVERKDRNDGTTQGKAIKFTVDCTGFTECCEVNAAAILCLKAPDTLKRVLNGKPDREAHYRRSGAKLQPFKDENLDKYKTTKRDNCPSAEEFPWESADVADEAGREVYLAGVPKETAQDNQGSYFSHAYDDQEIGPGKWFKIMRFDNCDTPYCEAFNDNKNEAVCDEKLDSDVMKWIYLKTSPKHAKPAVFTWQGSKKKGLKQRE